MVVQRNRFRARAEEARRLAARMTDERLKRGLERIADIYEGMAATTEPREPRRRPGPKARRTPVKPRRT